MTFALNHQHIIYRPLKLQFIYTTVLGETLTFLALFQVVLDISITLDIFESGTQLKYQITIKINLAYLPYHQVLEHLSNSVCLQIQHSQNPWPEFLYRLVVDEHFLSKK